MADWIKKALDEGEEQRRADDERRRGEDAQAQQRLLDVQRAFHDAVNASYRTIFEDIRLGIVEKYRIPVQVQVEVDKASNMARRISLGWESGGEPPRYESVKTFFAVEAIGGFSRGGKIDGQVSQARPRIHVANGDEPPSSEQVMRAATEWLHALGRHMESKTGK